MLVLCAVHLHSRLNFNYRYKRCSTDRAQPHNQQDERSCVIGSTCKCWMQNVFLTVRTKAASDRTQADYDPAAAMASAGRVCRRAAIAHLAASSRLLRHFFFQLPKECHVPFRKCITEGTFCERHATMTSSTRLQQQERSPTAPRRYQLRCNAMTKLCRCRWLRWTAGRSPWHCCWCAAGCRRAEGEFH